MAQLPVFFANSYNLVRIYEKNWILVQKSAKNIIWGPTFDSHKSFYAHFDIFRLLLEGHSKGVARDKEGTRKGQGRGNIYYNVVSLNDTTFGDFEHIK